MDDGPSLRDYANATVRVAFILSMGVCGWAVIGIVAAAFLDTTSTVAWWFMKIALVSAIVTLLLERLSARLERE